MTLSDNTQNQSQTQTPNQSPTQTQIVLKKRGRKSKKEIEEANKKASDIQVTDTENIVYTIEPTDDVSETTTEDIDENKPIAKKRGRKPKGGKIIQQTVLTTNVKEPKPNVILHLKCFFKELTSFNQSNVNVEGYSFLQSNNSCYEVLQGEQHIKCTEDTDLEYEPNKHKEGDNKEIWKKLKILEHNLHVDCADNKKSACFWDTCEFDNQPVYIPKNFINETYQVYGCFCSPECAVAHLMEENIDSSVKFERYQLINHIYSKVYNYTKNIKPAPNPYYMLDKYYGNLNIQEYRSLLRNERLYLIVDKPLTRIMPELHEDNDDFIINNKIIPTNNIKLRKIQKKQTKTNILSERFGMIQN